MTAPELESTPGEILVASSPLDFDPPALDTLSAGLEQFEIVAFLGRGTLGTVYKARQPKLERAAALKIYPSRVAADAQFARRFDREAQTMARMRHDNIMAIYNFGETLDGAWRYIAMEFVEGDTLERLLLKEDFDEARILRIAVQICNALAYAHARGVIHCDLKPANIMLDTGDAVKIADFGLARIVGDETLNSTLSHDKASIGTCDFVAPEQLDTERVADHRADIYSLGAILYRMLTGTVLRGSWTPPSHRNPRIDPRLDEIVAGAMQVDPAARPASVATVSEALQEILATLAKAPSGPRLNTDSAAPPLAAGRIPRRALAAASAQVNATPRPVANRKLRNQVLIVAGTILACVALLAGILALGYWLDR